MTLTQKIEQAEQRLREIRQIDREISSELHEKKKLASKLSRVELTNKQAAALLGKSVSTVQRWKREGKIQSMRAIDILNSK